MGTAVAALCRSAGCVVWINVWIGHMPCVDAVCSHRCGETYEQSRHGRHGKVVIVRRSILVKITKRIEAKLDCPFFYPSFSFLGTASAVYVNSTNKARPTAMIRCLAMALLAVYVHATILLKPSMRTFGEWVALLQ
jgi:predicted nucleic acid-binding Zn ribbon protein